MTGQTTACPATRGGVCRRSPVALRQGQVPVSCRCSILTEKQLLERLKGLREDRVQ